MLTHFTRLCTERYSCRAYDASRPVDDATVLNILECARLAPSACNRQPWTFVVVRDEARRRAILAKSRPAFIEAPVLVVCCGHHAEAWHRPSDGKDHTDVDISIATEHICLAAAAAGLGTCWVCSFDTLAARRECNLPDGVEPIAIIPLGYPAKDAPVPQKTRKPLDDIVICEKF